MGEIDSFKQDLGARVKLLRSTFNNKKLTQDDLADNLASVSRANLSRIEKGEIMASAIFLKEVSSFFKVPSDWLLTGKDFDIQPTLDIVIQKMIEAFNLLDNDSRNALKTYTAFLLSQKLPDVLEEALSKTRAPAPDPEPEPVKEEKRVYLPILGTAAAGTPILTEELLEGFLSVPTAKINKNSFLIRVKGESMIEANINSGDLVIINPQPTVETGEIALVKVAGEVTIKKFHLVDFEVRLKPANCSMKDIVVNDLTKIKVLGKVIGVIPAEEANQNMLHEFNEPNE